VVRSEDPLRARMARVLAAGVLLAAVFAVAVGGAAAPVARAAGDQATARHRFDDVGYWAGVFDDPARDAWQKPDALVAALRLAPGMTVVDLGAGTGYLSRRLSAAVGGGGSVLAVDIEPNLVERLRERAEREGSANLVPILASPDNPRLPRGSADVVLVVDTYHHVDSRVEYFGRLREALRPGGRVVVVDWRKEPLPVGPPPEHKLEREQVIDEMRRAGYALEESPDVLPYQYLLVFRSQASSSGSAPPTP
jgi:SAM-dependent methyltransferase